MPEYVTKDSGARQEFETGSRRDTQDGKPRIDLISSHALTRWGALMGRGAEKYGERNWEKGQPLTRYEASLFRHVAAYMIGDREEDHLAAVLFNAGGIIDHEERIARGELAGELDDRPAERRLTTTPSELRVGAKVRILTPAPSVEDITGHLVGTIGVVSAIDDEDDPTLDGGIYVDCTDSEGWYFSRASLEVVS